MFPFSNSQNFFNTGGEIRVFYLATESHLYSSRVINSAPLIGLDAANIVMIRLLSASPSCHVSAV